MSNSYAESNDPKMDYELVDITNPRTKVTIALNRVTIKLSKDHVSMIDDVVKMVYQEWKQFHDNDIQFTVRAIIYYHENVLKLKWHNQCRPTYN
jgi:hypothetical protein